MSQHATPAAPFEPFTLACKARDLTAQLEALKQQAAAKVPSHQEGGAA